MKKLPLLSRLTGFFLAVPLPDAVFQWTPRYLTGLRVWPRERRTGTGFVVPLPEGVLQPSLEKKNIPDPAPLKKALDEGMKKLGLSHGKAAVLMPELCVRVFLAAMESFPSSAKERDAVLRWKIAKQMPQLNEGFRIVSRVFADGSARKIVAAVAREAVVREYETLLSGSRLVPAGVSSPSLALLRLVPPEEKDFLCVNVEEDGLSFVAAVDDKPVLFRQKAFSYDSSGKLLSQRIAGLLQEIENTLRFLEDKEGKKLRRVWLRTGLPGETGDIASETERALGLSVRNIGSLVGGAVPPADRNILAPLFGHLT